MTVVWFTKTSGLPAFFLLSLVPIFLLLLALTTASLACNSPYFNKEFNIYIVLLDLPVAFSVPSLVFVLSQ